MKETKTLWQRCEALGPMEIQGIALHKFNGSWSIYIDGTAVIIFHEELPNNMIARVWLADMILQRFEAMACKELPQDVPFLVSSQKPARLKQHAIQMLHEHLLKISKTAAAAIGIVVKVYSAVDMEKVVIIDVFHASDYDAMPSCAVMPFMHVIRHGYTFDMDHLETFSVVCKKVGFAYDGDPWEHYPSHKKPPLNNTESADPIPDLDKDRFKNLWDKMIESAPNPPAGYEIILPEGSHMPMMLRAPSGLVVMDFYKFNTALHTDGFRAHFVDPQYSMQWAESLFGIASQCSAAPIHETDPSNDQCENLFNWIFRHSAALMTMGFSIDFTRSSKKHTITEICVRSGNANWGFSITRSSFYGYTTTDTNRKVTFSDACGNICYTATPASTAPIPETLESHAVSYIVEAPPITDGVTLSVTRGQVGLLIDVLSEVNPATVDQSLLAHLVAKHNDSRPDYFSGQGQPTPNEVKP